jgi:zinc and cadmium transporter
MSPLALILVASIAGGVASVLLASLFLLLPRATQERVVPHLVSFAVGTLLAAATLALLPEAFARGGVEHRDAVALTLLAGILVFFLIERLVLWRHCHSTGCPGHSPDRSRALVPLVLVGDSIHNFVDGVLLGAAYMADANLGLLATIAVVAHEIPQELVRAITIIDG